MRTNHSLILSLTAVIAAACASGKETTVQQTTTTTSSTATSTSAIANNATAPTRKGHVPINGVRYYYEIRGQGEPLLLLHGGLGSIEMFGPVLPALAQSRQVIAIDLHGHGRTQLGDRAINIVDEGDDVAALLEQLGYKQVDVLGYSLGGGVAFRLAVQHPEKVRRVVLASTGYSTDAYYKELRAMQGQVSSAVFPMMKDTPMYKNYVAIAPNPDEFPRLLDAIGDFMRKDFNYADDVKKLTMPVMLVYGDSDMFRPEHMIQFYQLLGGGLKDAGWQRENQSQNRLAILPDVTHYDLFMSPALVGTVLPFLDGKRGGASWSEQVAAQR
jgi:pimeloyl-ACP methyl ester carboxylesterase